MRQSARIKQTGGCACGAVRLEVTTLPLRVSICHCMTCRRVHGSAFGSYAMFKRGTVQFSGTTVAWRSSPDSRRHFCPLCGSVIFMECLSSDEVDLALGAFDEAGIYEPTDELWCRHKEPWLPTGVRKEYDEGRLA